MYKILYPNSGIIFRSFHTIPSPKADSYIIKRKNVYFPIPTNMAPHNFCIYMISCFRIWQYFLQICSSTLSKYPKSLSASSIWTPSNCAKMLLMWSNTWHAVNRSLHWDEYYSEKTLETLACTTASSNLDCHTLSSLSQIFLTFISNDYCV